MRITSIDLMRFFSTPIMEKSPRPNGPTCFSLWKKVTASCPFIVPAGVLPTSQVLINWSVAVLPTIERVCSLP